MGENIKFNEEYEKYSTPIEKNVGETENKTKLNLISTNYDGGYAVLEFRISFSEKDREYLKLGERIFTDEEIEEYKKEETSYWVNRMNNYENNSDMTKEEYEKYCEEKIEEIEKIYEEARFLKYNFEFVNNDDKYILDGKEYYVENSYKQNIEKISETEYRFYYYIFIPDEVLNGKEKFKLSFNNMKIKQSYDKNETDIITEVKDTTIIVRKFEDKKINLKGSFESDFSVEKALENTKILTPKLKEIKYNILSQNIENIKITPMQTIIKVKSILKGIRKDTLRTIEKEWNNPDYIGSLNFNMYNEKMNKINGIVFETSRIVKFPDGHIEEWERYQKGPNFEKNQTDPIGADMEIINYIVVSNEEYKEKINIYPTIEKNDDIVSYTYNEEIGEYYEIDIK